MTSRLSLVLCLSLLCYACVEPSNDPAAGEMPEPATPRRAPDGASTAPPDLSQDDPQVDQEQEPAPSEEEEEERAINEPGAMACEPGEARCLDAFPQQLSDSTVGGPSERDTYACAPDTDESGPERAYRVIVSEPGFLAARVSEESEGADIDLHILADSSASSCLDRGHLTAGAYLEAGTYWLVADSWVDATGQERSGDFTLEVNLVRAEGFARHGLSAAFAEDAFTAFVSAWIKGDSRRLEYLAIDFSLHSGEPRAWVLDLAREERLFHVTIGHGKGSIRGEDRGLATDFSNEPGSHKSSLGLTLAAETYTGDYGHSLRLDGLEPGLNDNVRPRAIVIHPDQRNRPEVTAEQGYLTPSRGCPTLDPATSRQVIDTIAEGALVFSWHPDGGWRDQSDYLN